jgi:hypothetical protein
MVKTKAQKARAKAAAKAGARVPVAGKRGKGKKQPVGMVGRGAYTGKKVSLADAAASGAGYLVDNLFGAVFGRGAYGGGGGGLPDSGPVRFVGSPDTVVTHREFIGDVTGSSTFAVASFLLNPTLPGTFPWLSCIAASWDEWEMIGCLFEYRKKSALALNSTNTALGTVIMATDYNLANANFVTKVDMENFDGAVSCVPSESFYHMIECKPRETSVETLFTNVNGSDLRFTTLGNFQIATVGMQATSIIGELWVTYKIRLKKPKLCNHANTSDFILYRNVGSSLVPTLVAGAAPPIVKSGRFAAASATTGVNNFVVTLEPTNSVVDFYAGQFLVMVQFSAGALDYSGPVPSITITSGLATVNQFAGFASFLRRMYDTTGFFIAEWLEIKRSEDPTVPQPPRQITLNTNGATWAADPATSMDCWIIPISMAYDPLTPSWGIDSRLKAFLDEYLRGERSIAEYRVALQDREEKENNLPVLVPPYVKTAVRPGRCIAT